MQIKQYIRGHGNRWTLSLNMLRRIVRNVTQKLMRVDKQGLDRGQVHDEATTIDAATVLLDDYCPVHVEDDN